MFSKVKWRKWKEYSGPLIEGTQSFQLNKTMNHWERIVWLTSQVETGGKFGATTCYDGTGNTSGLIQAIAVFPKELAHEDNNPENDQGPLWSLLEQIKKDSPELCYRLDAEFNEIGWTIKKGKVWHTDTLELVNGKVIREELTPNQGKVPKSGQQWQEAKGWALIFHEIFSNPKSFNTQINFGIKHAHEIALRKARILRGDTIEKLIYNGNIKDTKLFSWDDPMDLAMAISFSNAVNAPAMMFRKLKEAFEIFSRRPNWQSQSDRSDFARTLITTLGKADYGKWNFKITNGRYQRTRNAAMKAWPLHLFEGSHSVMSRSL